MTARNLVQLTCDGVRIRRHPGTGEKRRVHCGQVWQSEVHDRGIAAARVEAAALGWSRAGKTRNGQQGDVCPGCTALLAEHKQRQADAIRAAQERAAAVLTGGAP